MDSQLKALDSFTELMPKLVNQNTWQFTIMWVLGFS